MSEWQELCIEDVCDQITSGGTPSRKKPSFYEDGVWSWVKTKELGDDWLDDTEEHITAEAVTQSSAKVLPENTVLMAMYGATVGKLGIIRRPMTCNQACCAMIVNPKKADYRFLYYLLLFDRKRIISLANGAAQQNLSGQVIKQIAYLFPSLAEQKAIAEMLGALDDKIELNRRMNETLEAMAQAIFKDWFVDFGPTRAKMEGLTPYLAPALWSLFPDTLNADGIPDGWQKKPLDQVAHFLNGLALQKYPAEGEDYLPVIKIAELRAGITQKSDKASKNIPPKYIVNDGDLLFSWSGSLLHLIWSGGMGALNQHLFKVTSDQYPQWFYFHWIKEHMTEFRAIAISKTTTMGHIQRIHLAKADTVIPSDILFSAAGKVIEPFFDRMIANKLQSRTLREIRDLLLPRLMSGKLRVRGL